MLSQFPCGKQCTKKYAALTQIPWRMFCKKGCGSDAETFEECLEECDELCYKDPVIKDQEWSACFDRSPGTEKYSVECFHACVAGCGYKFEIPKETVEQVKPTRAPKPSVEKKPTAPVMPAATAEDLASGSA